MLGREMSEEEKERKGREDRRKKNTLGTVISEIKSKQKGQMNRKIKRIQSENHHRALPKEEAHTEPTKDFKRHIIVKRLGSFPVDSSPLSFRQCTFKPLEQSFKPKLIFWFYGKRWWQVYDASAHA